MTKLSRLSQSCGAGCDAIDERTPDVGRGRRTEKVRPSEDTKAGSRRVCGVPTRRQPDSWDAVAWPGFRATHTRVASFNDPLMTQVWSRLCRLCWGDLVAGLRPRSDEPKPGGFRAPRMEGLMGRRPSLP